MSRFSSFCGSAAICLPESATIVWKVTRPARRVLHDLHRQGGCHGSAPFGPDDLAGRRPRAVCENVGCVDLFMDVWTHAHTAVHAKFPDLGEEGSGAARAYLTATARSRVAELNRQNRVERGGVAKPQRRDGVIGRVSRSYDDPWLADVFRFLLGYAASPAGEGSGWPLDVLTERKNTWDGGARIVGGGAARAELRADVASCLATVRAVAGGGWLHDCIVLPLVNRGRAGAVPSGGDGGRPLWPDDPDTALVSAAESMLEDMLARVDGGAGPGTALRAAVEGWFGDDARPPAWAATGADDLAVRRLAKRLLADLRAHEAAA
ncbi:hypothetical protein [Actinomadura algeriensis]|uniref:C2H2-type domain-containing protein n=1 Tax=Actinomadura algeriensis TaxID=1679523 RepID=A0ABR9K1K0_9ACTN|nr:hypothetical protein [Actinomadura algeriensis]MBE1536711.1 hypothetical protein [Actinomadura algeriensis]